MPIQQHERAANQAKAEAALSLALNDVVERFGLTTAEVCVALSVAMTRWAGYQLRDERSKASPDEGKLS